MKVYVFGNGNINFDDFISCYATYLRKLVAQQNTQFIICDFRGVDTLTIEFLKNETENVSIYHIGDRSRYIPDRFKTKVSQWKFIGGFKTDFERDGKAIENCTHFLATDFNSDETRKSGTQKNIEKCLALGKIDIRLLNVLNVNVKTL
jgi:hypothetical protein